MDKILELKELVKIYGVNTKNPYKALHEIDLSIDKHSFNAIIGQSGSGKSTMLNIIGTLDKATKGQVLFNGEDLSKYNKDQLADFRNKKIGFIFQFHYLLPEFTALENVLMPFNISKKPITKDIEERANMLLETVGLEKYKNTISTNLSGGQQQRVAIARSLINQPDLVLADEPTGNLDSDSTENVYQLLRKINKELKTTFIIITHDRKIAEKTDRIIELKDGKIYADIKK
ncbi:ABC transporter ATP-binding protein [Mycoplasmatota bacterium]|nr:ABC transporter ATP-binding protein [Mycoplasmatota bacterium]